MLVQIPYSFDEILATLQFLRQRRRQGKSLWHVLLHGDTIEGGSADYLDNFEASPGAVLKEMLKGGVTLPGRCWRASRSAIGLMLTRLLFGTTGLAADNDHVIGSLVITLSIMALAEVARPMRLVNAAFGAWLVLTAWIFEGYPNSGTAFAFIAGLLLIALSLPRGAIESHYGAWDRFHAHRKRRLASGQSPADGIARSLDQQRKARDFPSPVAAPTTLFSSGGGSFFATAGREPEIRREAAMEKIEERPQAKPAADGRPGHPRFVREVFVFYGIGLLLLAVLVLLGFAIKVLLLIFAAILFAILLHDAGGWLQRWLPVSRSAALTAILLAAVVTLGGRRLAAGAARHRTEQPAVRGHSGIDPASAGSTAA
jgi:hypothetical protein